MLKNPVLIRRVGDKNQGGFKKGKARVAWLHANHVKQFGALQGNGSRQVTVDGPKSTK